MTRLWILSLGLTAALAGCSNNRSSTPITLPPVDTGSLRSVELFDVIEDDTQRSRQLFQEMAKVFQHPRCSNCHPNNDRPRQGMAQIIHDPPVWRGPDNHGEPGARCTGCHQDQNSPITRVPGAPEWHLAPTSMGWIGRTDAEICHQLKDPERNGGKDLEAIHHHIVNDPLVAWGWNPGHGRESAPGSQAQLGALTRAWIDSGAACPDNGGDAP